MSKPTVFFKSFDKNLQGRNGFQYEIGKTFVPGTDDQWHWLHFSAYVAGTLIHNDADMRICEVKPLGQVNFYRCTMDGYGKGEYNTDQLIIVRELSREEIFDRLIREKCRPYLFLKLKPPFEVLMQVKDRFTKGDKLTIMALPYLTVQQKKRLLPASYYRRIERMDQEIRAEAV